MRPRDPPGGFRISGNASLMAPTADRDRKSRCGASGSGRRRQFQRVPFFLALAAGERRVTRDCAVAPVRDASTRRPSRSRPALCPRIRAQPRCSSGIDLATKTVGNTTPYASEYDVLIDHLRQQATAAGSALPAVSFASARAILRGLKSDVPRARDGIHRFVCRGFRG